MPLTPIALALLLASAAPAQPPADAPPPQVLLGRRADVLRLNLKVRPTVVIVSSNDDFVRAIARWSLAERYPILIDDGTSRAREDIARFVRAFEPKSVLTWKAEAAPDDRLPDDPALFREAIEAASRLAWGARDAEALAEIWKQSQFTPFGVVVASPADPAWTAALALSAGRGQPILWIESKPASISQFISEDQAQALDSALAGRLDELGRPWRGMGDDIDALTLCLSLGVNINAKSGRLALTDALARAKDGTRAAYVGVIPGESPRAAYLAMCSLFLQPRHAWLFDGYKPEMAPPYAVPAAAKLLDQARVEVSTNTPPLGGLSHWRQRTLDGVNFDFIHVNSSGNADFFDLTPGRAFVGDVPFLNKPAMVHFIHSFSLQNPASAQTIGGRWLENGAYCYYGSMDEPFLGAFLPSQIVVTRLLLGAPFAAAVRQDDTRVWKLNVFGDPLATMGRPAPRYDEPLSLEGAVNLEDRMKSALKAQRLDEALAALILLGRDKDAARVASAALADNGQSATPTLAAIALPAAFRERSDELFYGLYERLTPDIQRSPLVNDMLWQVARQSLDSTDDRRVLAWLRASIREECMCDDAEAIAPALRRVFGVEAARSMYGMLLHRATAENVRQRLQKEAARY
ncbi:MAG: hypothetical protein JNK58_01160 [Phycisphaerae bacterium]|nr:hypothetical protein [Phycisphaerae bacterium]